MEEADGKENAREDYKKWVDLEEICWRQKSREHWLKGDKNIGFFHRMANFHRRRNSLMNISINGRRFDPESELKEGLVGAFQSLLFAPNSW